MVKLIYKNMSESTTRFEIKVVNIKDLSPAEYNPRKIDEKSLKGLMGSIEEFGIVEPIVVNKDWTIIGGHQRVKACKKLGWEAVPCHVVDLSKEKEKMLNLLLNSQEIQGRYDGVKLGFILEELKDTEGYEELRLDKLEKRIQHPDDLEDLELEVPEPLEKTEMDVKLGDVYQLGEHILVCGDSTDPEVHSRLMGKDKAKLMFTDPPYNVSYEGQFGNKRDAISNDKFDDGESFKLFLSDAFKAATASLEKGAPFYVCHADTETINFRTSLEENSLIVKECIIWVKNQFVMGRQDYQWQHEPILIGNHEPILYGWKEGDTHPWFGGRNKTTVWNFDRPARSEGHPTMKPVKLVMFAINNSSKVGDIVLEPFSGSGSTLMACEQMDRKCRAIELEPKYVEYTIKRWEEFTNKKVVKLTK